MDYKRVTLSYLFFVLGILLTIYQYYHLIREGPLTPWTRQFVVIGLNTLAVYAGVLLVHPEQTNPVIASDPDKPSIDLRRHFQRLVLGSMIFCFLTMLGIAVAIITDDPHSLIHKARPMDIATGELIKEPEEPSFSLATYSIAIWYMLGYGMLGLGTRFVRKVFYYFNRDSGATPPRRRKRPRAPEEMRRRSRTPRKSDTRSSD